MPLVTVPATMTAVVTRGHGGPETMEVRDDVPVPAPGPGEVLVRVTAAALNNTDVWTREGAYGLPGDPDALAGGMGPVDFPRIQGGDAAGVVAALGAGVDDGWVGRRVLVDPGIYGSDADDALIVGALGSEADGAFAEYVRVGRRAVHDVTGSPLDDDQLACLPIAYGTASGMLARVGLRGGESVVVTGASGGVGLALVQLAAARGARVMAVSSAAKADLVRDAGADVVLDRGAGPPGPALAALVPDGVDVVADVVGGPGLGELLDALASGGRAVVAGAVAGPVVELDLRRLYLANRTLVGSTMHTPAHFAELAGRARAGEVAPRVAATYPLTELPAAQRAFLARDHVGKIVVRPGG